MEENVIKRDRGRGGTTNTQITLYTRGMEVIRSVPAGPAVLLPWAEKRPGRSRPLVGGNTQPTRHCNLAGLRAERSSPRLPEALPDLLTKKICNRHRPQIHQITAYYQITQATTENWSKHSDYFTIKSPLSDSAHDRFVTVSEEGLQNDEHTDVLY